MDFDFAMKIFYSVIRFPILNPTCFVHMLKRYISRCQYILRAFECIFLIVKKSFLTAASIRRHLLHHYVNLINGMVRESFINTDPLRSRNFSIVWRADS